MKKSVSIAALIAGMLAPSLASASVANVSTFYFSGLCIDCSAAAGSPFTATAELNLANYTIGDAITSTNFVSFHYDGSNLIPSFTLTGNDVFLAVGSITQPFPGPENVLIGSFDNYSFMSSTDGTWSVNNFLEAADYGVAGSYSAPSAVVSGIPETSTWAMMLLGFGGLGFFAYRRGLGSRQDTNLLSVC